tara:strand:- start:138 stop:2378 length:2241 start_codon:yes stop_codon:yes gene_type:complete
MAKLAKEIEVIVEEPEIEVVLEEPKAEAAPAELEIPEGGIGGFAMADEDFEVLEAEEAKKEFGEDGLAQFTEQAKKMAGYGRFGDDSVAHIQTGEIVVPLALIENNPALKEQIFESLRENGIEDPEQYVVGSTANSINPETGLMEFGFLKKIFKGIKKFFKSVVKVVKKIAPIVLPVALSMFGPLGAIYGAAVGSGIGTLIAGGNIKDALKAGLISGATGGLMKGIGGAMSGQGFLKSITAELAAPGARFAQLGQGISNTAKNIIPGGEVGAVGGPTITSAFNSAGGGTSVIPETVPQEYVSGMDVSGNPISTGAQEYVSGMDVSGNPISTGAETPRTFSQKIADRMFRGGDTPTQVEFAKQQGGIDAVTAAKASGITDPTRLSALAEAGIKEAGPGLLTRFGPSVLAGTALASGAGFFKVPEQDMFGDPSEGIDRNPDGSPVTGQDLIDANPRRYLVEDLGSRRLNAEGEYEDVENYLEDLRERATDVRVATDNPLRVSIPENPGSPFARPFVQRAAEGGLIFPQDDMYRGVALPQDDMYRGVALPQDTLYSGSGNLSPQNNIYGGSGNLSPQNNMYSGSGNLSPEDAMYSGIGSGSTPAAPTVPSGQDLIDADPGKYLIGDLGSSRLNAEGEYEKVEDYSQILQALRDNAEKVGVPTNYRLSGNAGPPVQIAAEGGPIFPRRNGGIAPTEGVQGQDSVRAMLMPGEFVMTTDAVRGLGDGNLNNGIKSMYAVMRNLESRGREAA